MLPQMRQIQRLVVLPQSAQWERSVEAGDEEKGIGRAARVVFEDVGCEESRVCEYLHTGHLIANGKIEKCVRMK